jgi:hypothetical protein|mmetsp:Transcript_14570/g.26314  ORF Transcript_14570/g.26314 Transcript_14570/m.26314 type:complete len:325 (-) Transcript_14570:271-1245(-)|eukprot:CAMPEP_0174301320 /NCGR_PEP_ID=MMETSP0809-20121228/58973_1 /TAXON_ID=73025 ORGANISM="Eutreptiella gymnastica-like, Strain CCMP1594" /NCGR_SAMPLE_ID=MMETSP0809 /ASSEMBLY_ACC=CAM_ASM_000658 /LENGTH=324 /DNA_ID=CAMNT_0015407057 /DNA_START=69 /DNA_END=1043 /DNA_ORIENTATION=-
MGCVNVTPQQPPAPTDTPASADPAPIQTEEFWLAGTVQAGTNGVPEKGPFRKDSVPVQHAKYKILFNQEPIGPEIKPGFNGVPTLPRNGPIYARAFFPHCLTCFVVGWAKLQVSLEHPHYNCKKQREHEKDKIRLGRPIDYSKRKTYYIYPERVSEIALLMQVDGKKIETEVATSNTSWPADPIPGAFFTFVPDQGSIFGENSLPIPIWPKADDPLLDDVRWSRLRLEFQRVLSKLSAGQNHELRLDLKYRYGNSKFTAWRGVENDTGVYRYSDDDRVDAAVSESVANGTVTVKFTSDELKALKKMVEEGDQKLKEQQQEKEKK